jgi:hypothetical protein
MKTRTIALLVSLTLGLATLTSLAHEQHTTAAKKTAGPNGGRILTGLNPRAEFFVTADRKVQITFINGQGEKVAPTGQAVTVTAGDRAAPTKLSFARSGNALLSDVALPAGDGIPTVVQIVPAPGEKVVTAKFNLNLATCPECKHAEYACICDH